MAARKRVTRTPSGPAKRGVRSNKASLGTETRSWGEQAFPGTPSLGFHSAGLLIPRLGHDAPDETFSPGVGTRAKASLGVALHVRRPQKNVREVFDRLKLVDVRSPTREPAAKLAKVGMYSSTESMGIAAAYFRSRKQEEDLLNEVGDEYEFVPDFALSLPCRVGMDESPAGRRLGAAEGRAAWPEESGIAQAHASGVRGAGVLIAALDTGVDADHAEFLGRRIVHRHVSFVPNSSEWPPRDVRGFDTDGHGTHVSGILCGRSVGVAPEAVLHVAGVIESETTLTSITRVVAGLQWVMRQFTRPENERLPGVLNMSLGFPDSLSGQDDAVAFGQRLRTMEIIIRSLAQANILTVAAIGNEGQGKYGFPGAFRDALGVGAVDFGGTRATFSGSGPISQAAGLGKPDLMGYGVGVNSAIERDYDGQSIYQTLNGTSMASPYVAGIAALYRSRQPKLSVEDTVELLLANAASLPHPKRLVGAGLARYR